MEGGRDRTAVIRAAAGGDESAFAELVNAYAARLRWLVQLRIDPALRARVSVDDVLQDALVVASQSIRDFVVRDEPAFWAWLCRVVEHRLIDARRRHLGARNREACREERRDDGDAELPAFDPPAWGQSSPSERLKRAEDREILQRALESLAASHREVIVLRVLEGQSLAETARLLERTPGAVSVLLHKAMQRLAHALERDAVDLGWEPA